MFSARDTRIDVVLIDTAGRMQDNEPLMRALAKVRSHKSLAILVCFLEKGITFVHPCSRNKSNQKDKFIFSCYVWNGVVSENMVK